MSGPATPADGSGGIAIPGRRRTGPELRLSPPPSPPATPGPETPLPESATPPDAPDNQANNAPSRFGSFGGGLAVASIALLATSPGGTSSEIPSPTRGPAFLQPVATRSLSTPLNAPVISLGLPATPAVPDGPSHAASSPALLAPSDAYAVQRSGSFPGTSEIATTTTIAVTPSGKPADQLRRARSLSSPAHPAAAMRSREEPIATWKLQPERPVTAMCGGPKPGQVFAGSRETVVLLDGDDGSVLRELRIPPRQLGRADSADSPTSPGLPSSPRLDAAGSGHRHSLELTDKDFIATIYWVEDPEGLYTGPADRAARRNSFASDRSGNSPFAGGRGRRPSAAEVEPMILDSGPAVPARTSMDRASFDMDSNPTSPEAKPKVRSGIAALVARRRSSPHSVRSVDTSNSSSDRPPSERPPAEPSSPNLVPRSQSPTGDLPRGWLVAHYTLYRVVQWDLSYPTRPRRIYPSCACIHLAPRSHLLWGACDDRIFRQWDVRTGQCVREVDAHGGQQVPKCIAVGTKHLFATLGDHIERWSLETGQREVSITIRPPEPLEEDPLRRRRPRQKVPPVFTEHICLPPPGDPPGAWETDLYGKSARHGVFAWDFRSDPRGAYMRWPVMFPDPASGNDRVHWLHVPTVPKGARRRLWIAGERAESGRGREVYVEEYDALRREKLRSWRLAGVPMSMCVVLGEGGRMFVGNGDGVVSVFDVVEEPVKGTGGRVVRDIYG